MAEPGRALALLSACEEAQLTLKCLRCSGELETHAAAVTCRRCGARWPVVRCIPRFFQVEDYYWGEIDRQEASRLVTDARELSWKAAVQTCFKTAHMQDYCLDLQRASWLALLGLPSTAIALDIGCGYGAITHSMALSLAHVYAIEAIPERIEFTQERLSQEQISNVTLLQASATGLPFFENSFDLIVANGVLEWIGEWDLDGSPHAAQLRFLSSLQRLLKKDGILVVGIENRFALGAFRGGLDHSGRPYTSIVPRWLATAILRRSGKTGRYVPWAGNSTKEYRTYTYSAFGYRKLLKEAGFEAVSLYWAKPGYNHPHRLIPFESVALQADDFERWPERNGSSKPPLLTRSAKSLAGNLYPWFANSYVIVAAKNQHRKTLVDAWLREVLAKYAAGEQGTFSEQGKLSYAAHTHNRRHKTVLYFWSPEVGRIQAIAKVNLRKTYGKMGDAELEFRGLERVREKLMGNPNLNVHVPKPLSCLRDGNNAYAVVSLAQGTVFNRITSAAAYPGSRDRLRRDLVRLIGLGADLSEAFQSLDCVPPIDLSWRKLPGSVASDGFLSERVKRLRYFSEPDASDKLTWVQHGDFAMENIFFQEQTEHFEVIDWDDLASGLPPLYDIFTLIVQAGWSRFIRQDGISQSWLSWRLTSFLDIFVEKTELAALVAEPLLAACERLRVDPSLIPSLLVEFLLIRIHYNDAREEPDASGANLQMLIAYVDHLSGARDALTLRTTGPDLSREASQFE